MIRAISVPRCLTRGRVGKDVLAEARDKNAHKNTNERGRGAGRRPSLARLFGSPNAWCHFLPGGVGYHYAGGERGWVGNNSLPAPALAALLLSRHFSHSLEITQWHNKENMGVFFLYIHPSSPSSSSSSRWMEAMEAVCD